MERLAIQDAGSIIVQVVSLGFRWLEAMAQSLLCSISRWWGGTRSTCQNEHMVWEAYKEARDAMMSQEPNDTMRLARLLDIRSEFRLAYPVHAKLWS
jgi:hypothetical protein